MVGFVGLGVLGVVVAGFAAGCCGANTACGEIITRGASGWVRCIFLTESLPGNNVELICINGLNEVVSGVNGLTSEAERIFLSKDVRFTEPFKYCSTSIEAIGAANCAPNPAFST